MCEDWFDVAFINMGSKAILHGRRKDGSEVERELDLREGETVQRLATRHEIEMQNLLRGMAGELEIVAAPAA
jgi:riboflavin synthase alpha subunit